MYPKLLQPEKTELNLDDKQVRTVSVLSCCPYQLSGTNFQKLISPGNMSYNNKCTYSYISGNFRQQKIT